MGLFGNRRRSTPAPPPQVSIGQYAECPLPQDPRATLLSNLLPTQLGLGPSIAAVRLGASTDRPAHYYGTNRLAPLRYPLSGPPKINQPEDLETAIYKPNQ
jgi:hypothetical protein